VTAKQLKPLPQTGISVVDAGKFAAFLEAIVPDESLGLERNLQS
jgi:hypothetical protein